MSDTNTTSASESEVVGAKEVERSTAPYTADNGDSNSVAAADRSHACAHEGYYYCKKCGEDLTTDIAPFTGTYGDGPNCARSVS